MAYADHDSMQADGYVRRYYLDHKPLLWMDRMGTDHRADSLVAYLHRVDSMGFGRRKFALDSIEQDLRHLRSLDFEHNGQSISRLMGRLEYRLTKAYLRYAIGQRFGFVNPSRILNRLDVLGQDTVSKSYRRLFDIRINHVSREFVSQAFTKVKHDSVTPFLRALEPASPMYETLRRKLMAGGHTAAQRIQLLVNMERCRWRMADYPQQHDKYVLVNIPSFHLRAVDGDSVMSMRIAFGSMTTKTPLLISRIKRMDINPQWIMPRSIIEKSIVPHAGNQAYFERRNYFIRDRHTGERINAGRVSRSMLLSGDYMVIQRGGEGNALGRIIFRFDNNLSIYLHDTSSRDVFQQADRDVSHGCVRVQHPFELATFLLGDEDERLTSKISYSMQADVSPLGQDKDKMTDKMREVADTLRRDMLVGSVTVEPTVPVYILYYTLYPDTEGHMVSYPDVYGYDRVLYSWLRSYI